ncbi:hypothetical protein [Dongshaea marina]|uniref:hypothetical protein n=1 Tax=Dongshaea marina TaxID=2047966 RepID=UPI00131F4522|nr:hypothetical protein [Dongshaea marina]
MNNVLAHLSAIYASFDSFKARFDEAIHFFLDAATIHELLPEAIEFVIWPGYLSKAVLSGCGMIE